MLSFVFDAILHGFKYLSLFLGVLGYYLVLYWIIGFFKTRVFPPAKKQHRLAIVVAARNEEAVLENLLESIGRQDYPHELVTTFVVADHCTDRTAEVARARGAICYERSENSGFTKGYALRFLFEKIKKDFGIEAFEAYILFDADNLLASDYLSRMNEAFDAGEDIVTAYRNTKNPDDNWISASYAIHWLRTVRTEHRARSVLHLATRIQGTGFLFSNKLVREGWRWVSLTEDRAFSADAVAEGYRISYCDAAQFYDEQPSSLRIALRQRLRWAKGHLQAFAETGPQLFRNIFTSKSFPFSFMSYDMLYLVIPRPLIESFHRILLFFFPLILFLADGHSFREVFSCWMPILHGSILAFFSGIIQAAYVFIMEKRRLKPIPLWKKLWFILTFPLFDFIGRLSILIALFIPVGWKPIPHTSEVTVSDLSVH